MKFQIKPDLEIEVDGISALKPKANPVQSYSSSRNLTFGTEIRYIDGSVTFIQDMTTEEVHARITAFRETFR